jgi:hypothetical protein
MAVVGKDPDPGIVAKPAEYRLGVVGRSLVEDDQLPVRKQLRSNALDRVSEEATVVVTEDVDRDRRLVLERQDRLPESEQDCSVALARRPGSNRVSHRVAF